MKIVIGIILIFVGLISVFRYPDLGKDMAETAGALTVVLALIGGGILLIISGNKKKKK